MYGSLFRILSAGSLLLEMFLATLHEVRRLLPLSWSEMNLHELAMTCHEVVPNIPQYMTVRRVAARSAHNQRVLWSWHLVCSGPALPQQIGRWRLTATKWPFILNLPAGEAKPALFSPLPWEILIADNTKLIGTSTSHKALEQWSLFQLWVRPSMTTTKYMVAEITTWGIYTCYMYVCIYIYMNIYIYIIYIYICLCI